jgi:hypothetical protein
MAADRKSKETARPGGIRRTAAKRAREIGKPAQGEQIWTTSDAFSRSAQRDRQDE